MIDSIKIEGYKSIKCINLELKPINILIGSNGSGKSNFISFFEFLNRVYDKKLAIYVNLNGGMDKMLHKGSKITECINIDIEFDNSKNGYAFKIIQGADSFIFTNEYLVYNREEGQNISGGGTEANIKSTDNFRKKYVEKYLKSYKKYHFHDTSVNSPFTKSSNIQNDIYFLYEKGDNLAAFLYHIKETNSIVYNRIIKTIQSIAPYFSDFYLEPNKEGLIRLQWQDKYSSTVYGVNDLSDGTIRFIALSVLFLQPDLPSSIIIDEPELGLHPFAIAKLAGMISSAAAKGCQIITATQSTDLISHFQPEDIITVDQIRGESQFNRLDTEELSSWLKEYTIDDLWKRSIIQGGHPNND
ncbi:MAG: AAA family ATPase [Bacteroides sp.]|jgi:predicted ATPase|nr:AAA family ATPase [Bacteroides sp.]